jgi:hypothetical protein
MSPDYQAHPPDQSSDPGSRRIEPGPVGWRWGEGTIQRDTATLPPAQAAKRPPRGPRRSRLTVKRIDPWSMLKLSFVFSLAAFLVFLAAVVVVYAVLAGMGVFDAVNTTLGDLTSAGSGLASLLTFGHIFGFAVFVGAINVVLITALATLGSFIYNLCASLVGGIEVVLSDRE